VRIAPDSAEFSRLEALLKQATIAKDGTLNLSPDILDSIVAQVEKQMEEDE
jgi:hypothetical protein